MNWIMFIAVFLAMMITDIMWAKYTLAVAFLKPVLSGIYSAVIILMGAVTVVAYVEDRSMLIPAMLGAFVGTYYTIKRARDYEEEK